MRERYENGDVALEVREVGGTKGYVLEVGHFAYVMFGEESWAQLRELLEAYWEEMDGCADLSTAT